MEGAAAGKARLPTAESLTDGTMRRLVAVDLLSYVRIRLPKQMRLQFSSEHQ